MTQRISDWIEFARLHLSSGIVSVSDTSYFFDDFLSVELGSGEYRVSVFMEGDGDIALLRATRVADCKRGDTLGNVGIDFAQIGLCDRELTERSFEAFDESQMSEFFDLLKSQDYGEIRYGSIHIAFCRSGLGDGEYDVFELLDPQGDRVGIEVDFDIY